MTREREIVTVGIQMGHGYDAESASMSASPLQSVKFVTDNRHFYAQVDLDKRAIVNVAPELPVEFPNDRVEFLFERLNALRGAAIARTLVPKK